MRVITRSVVEALKGEYNFKLDNTEVVNSGQETKMYLHGNLIAEYITNPFTKNELYIYSAGWETNTTKERLNGILEYFNLGKIQQIKGEWFLIDGDFKEKFNGQKNFTI